MSQSEDQNIESQSDDSEDYFNSSDSENYAETVSREADENRIGYRKKLHAVVSQLYYKIRDVHDFECVMGNDSEETEKHLSEEAFGVELRKCLLHYQLKNPEMFQIRWDLITAFVHNVDHTVSLSLIETFVEHFYNASKNWSTENKKIIFEQLGEKFKI